VVALFGAACGGPAPEIDSNAVASTADLATTDSAEGAPEKAVGETADATELAPDEAVLEFSQCMRDEGLDFPDIALDAESNLSVGQAIREAGADRGNEDFGNAMDVCNVILEGIGFGGGGRGQLVDNPEVQDAFVAYSECLRDEGLDVGDLQLGGGQGRQPQDGGAADGAQANDERPERGEGQGQGGFADRRGRIADQLDLDAEDPQVDAAMETCQPILDDALGGIGQPNADA